MQHHKLLASLGLALSLLAVNNGAQAAPDLNAAPVKRALALIAAQPKRINSSGADTYAARDWIVDRSGAEHVRFDRRYRGLPVLGGDFVVHQDAAGRLASVSQTLTRPLNVDLKAAFTEADAIRVAEAAFTGTREGRAIVSKLIDARSTPAVLAYDVRLAGVTDDGTPTRRHWLVNAGTLALIDGWDEVQTAAATATGNSLLSGVIALTTDSQSSGGYVLRDPSRGGQATVDLRNTRLAVLAKAYTDSDNVWGDFTNSDRATVGVDAAYGAALTWDYFLVQFGRRGIADDGVGATSRVHYGRNYVNAFWDNGCFCMTYGDGDGGSYLPLVAVDIAGHEMTHGVTSRTANLTYSGESGGLNEAMSDIFGTLVEYAANNSVSTPNYLIGERIYTANNGSPTPTQALRYMFKPSLDNKSPDCYVGNIGNLDVHYSSGVANHFFYLLTQGAVSPPGFTLAPSALVCNGNTAIRPISRDQAAQILYRALTVYMTSSTGYAGARSTTLQAAADLYGTQSAAYTAVAAAWAAVGVN